MEPVLQLEVEAAVEASVEAVAEAGVEVARQVQVVCVGGEAAVMV